MVKICQDSRLAISSFHGQYDEYPPIFGYILDAKRNTGLAPSSQMCAGDQTLHVF
jgi:hypothetical protein